MARDERGAPRHRAAPVAVLALLFACAAAWAGEATASETLRYHLDYTSQVHSDLRAVFGQPADAPAAGLVHDIHSRLQADLVQRQVRVDGQDLVGWQLLSPQVTLSIDGVRADDHANELAAQLRLPVVATLDAQGLVTGLRFDPAADEAAQAFARALFAAIQFSRPPRGAKAWDTTEDDQAGRYLAHYRRLATDSFERTRLRYQPPPAGGNRLPAGAQRIDPSGATRARMRGGVLEWLQGDERQQVRVADNVIASGGTQVELTRIGAGTVADADGVALLDAIAHARAAGDAAPLSVGATTRSSDASLHRQQLGADGVDELLARLRSLAPDQAGGPAETALYLKFKALAYLRPQDSPRLGEALASAPAGSPSLLVLSQALSAIGDAPAQAALVHALQARRDDWPAMAALLPALGGVSEPTAQTIDALLAVAAGPGDADTVSTARLAVGTLARNDADAQAAPRSRLLDWMARQLDAATDDDTRRDYVLALGNARSSRALPWLLRYSGAASADLRAASMRALGPLPDPSAQARLLAGLASDEDADVRVAAASALASRPMDRAAFEVHRAVFTADGDERVRVAVLQNLAAAAGAFAEIPALLQSATTDASATVREAAERLR